MSPSRGVSSASCAATDHVFHPEEPGWEGPEVGLFPCQVCQLRIRLGAQAQSHPQFLADLSHSVNYHERGKVGDFIAPSEFLSQRRTEVHVEELDFFPPIAFKPMHDGPGRLAAQSEVGEEVQDARLPAANPLFQVVGGREQSCFFPPPDRHGPEDRHRRRQRRPERPRGFHAAQDVRCRDESGAGQDEQRVSRHESVCGVNPKPPV